MPKVTEFNQLIKAYTDGQLSESAFSEAVTRFFERDAEINPNDFLADIQNLLNSGNLSPDVFRTLVKIITEININRALNNSSAHDETLIMRQSGNSPSDETLIMPNSGSKGRDSGDGLPIGHTIKNRFELLEIIGRGGMGVVYKARDLVKIQAQDNNPYMAVKVLSESFKKYSRAFIALQREASKAQRLAHPNIATVFDFDRDSDTIFMTMELLSGQPFDKLIAQLPPGGLPEEQALRYITDLGNGLAYAHKQNLIHSDLKPANIFLCDSDVVKLLDFGITRAFKQEESSDNTLFDPSSLKALTPAYATIEMFRRESPDPRDDIYALACVAYELLTGAHPYKKVAAHKALELGLKPPPIKGLSRRQQKALNQALALKRSERTKTIEEFLRGIRRPKSHAKQLAAAGSFIVLLSGVLLFILIQIQSKADAQLKLIQSIRDGDRAKLVELLSTIEQQNETSRISLAHILRKEIIGYYQERINNAINVKAKRYDFPEASRLLQQVQNLYPDSASLAEAEKQLNLKKAGLIETLLKNYAELVKNNQDTRRVIEILKEVDPAHPLLQTTALLKQTDTEIHKTIEKAKNP